MHFSGDVKKNCCFESFGKFIGKPCKSSATFKQFEMTNHPPITVLKTDSTANVFRDYSENL